MGVGLAKRVRPHAVGVDGQQFTGLDVADERGADDVERRGLGGHHPAAIQPAERQRPHAVRVAGGIERVLVHEGQAERAAHRRQQLERGLLERGVGRAVGQQRAEDVGVGGGSGRAAHPDQACVAGAGRQLGGVDQVAVVTEGDAGARGGVAEHRLGVLPRRGASGGVAAVADGDVALHGGERLLVEHLADEAEILEHQHLRAVGDGDARRLLAAVLQGIQAVVRELGHVLAGGPDAEDATFLFGVVLEVGVRLLDLLGGHDQSAPWGCG